MYSYFAPSALRCASSIAGVVLFVKKQKIHIAAPSCRPLMLRASFNFLNKTDDLDAFKRFERLGFHLHGNAFSHFENVFGNCSVVLCRRVCQAVLLVVECVLEAVVYFADRFQPLLITASPGLVFV